VPSPGSSFSRGIEIQILDLGYDVPGKNQWYSTHGDIFAVNGAELTVAGRISPDGIRSFPSEERTLASPQWNHYHVEANDGDIRLSVNGKQVTIAENAKPRKGYLMLESEGARCQFRNLQITELPSTSPTDDEVARNTDGFVPLLNGINFEGWDVPKGDGGHWQVADGVVDYDAASEATVDKNLWTTKQYKNFELIVDWRLKETPYLNPKVADILPDGSERKDENGSPVQLTLPDSDSGILLRGSDKYQVNIWCWPIGSGEMYGVRRDPAMSPETRTGVTPIAKADNKVGQWNRFEIRVVDEMVSVKLNDVTVLPGVKIPGLPEEGRIGFQHHGSMKDGRWNSPPSLIQFRNAFIRELP